MSNWLLISIFAICSYFIGNFNTALIISKAKNKDIRKMGSGNPGTLNMSRNFGLKLGLLTFFVDILKGVIPTLISFFVFRNKGFFPNTEFYIYDLVIYICGFCVVLGHIYPALLKFKGGKGIASSIGVFIVTECVHGWSFVAVLLMTFIAAILFIYFTEFGAMGSFIAITPPAVAGSIRLFMLYGKPALGTDTVVYYVIANMLIFAICLFTWFAHRKNIERMLSGEEHPTSIKSMVVKKKAQKVFEKENKM